MAENSTEVPQDIKKLTDILDRGNEKALSPEEIKTALAELKAAMKDNKGLQGAAGVQFAQEYLDFKKDGKIDSPTLPRGEKTNTTPGMNEARNVVTSKPVNWERQGSGDIRETFNLAVKSAGDRFTYEITKPVDDSAGDTAGSEGIRNTLIHEMVIKIDGEKIATVFAPKFPETQTPPYILKIVTSSGRTEIYQDKNGKHSAENIGAVLVQSLKGLLPQ